MLTAPKHYTWMPNDAITIESKGNNAPTSNLERFNPMTKTIMSSIAALIAAGRKAFDDTAKAEVTRLAFLDGLVAAGFHLRKHRCLH